MYIYGKNVVKETLENKKKIKKAYVYKKFNDREIFELDKLVGENHQGIILVVDDYKYEEVENLVKSENSLIVILDHITDPHNFGAIIRTCEAAGVDGIIIPKDRSVQVNSTVIKVSTGAIENVKISKVTNLVNTINYLKKNGYWIVGTDMNGTNYTKLDYKGKIALIIGNEGEGMGRLVKDSCDFIASIPMIGKTNSLNASVAAGILIYEVVKQNNAI